MCENCYIDKASNHCRNCQLSYCSKCFSQLHSVGIYQTHVHADLGEEHTHLMCSACQGAIGSQECLQCNDLYCHNCFQSRHKRKKNHLWQYNKDLKFVMNGEAINSRNKGREQRNNMNQKRKERGSKTRLEPIIESNVDADAQL